MKLIQLDTKMRTQLFTISLFLIISTMYFLNENGVIANQAEAVKPIKIPFLVKRTNIVANSRKDSLNLFQSTLAQAQEQPLQLIISPGVDENENAYYWVGLRIDRNEVELIIPANEETTGLSLAYMCGAKELPVVEDATPFKVPSENKIAWYEELEKIFLMNKAARKERIEVTSNGTYLKVSYQLTHGKITFNRGKVENLLDIIRN